MFHEMSVCHVFKDLRSLLYSIGFYPVAGAILLLLFSFLARAIRYKAIASERNERIPLRVAWNAVVIGRAYTLITPTALFGGQPVSYFTLTSSGVSWKTSGMVVFATTFWDFIFFCAFAPFLYTFVSSAQDIHAVFYQLSLFTLIFGGIFLLIVVLMFLPCGYVFIRSVSRLLSKIPFLNKSDIEINIYNWVISTRQCTNSILRNPLKLLKMLVLTACGFFPVYIGIFLLLRAAGFSVDLYNSVIRQTIVNSTSLFFSPGGGSVTGELGFISLFSPYKPAGNILPSSLLFSAYSYWLSIFLGVIVAILMLKKNRGSLLHLTVTKNFLSEYPTVEALRVSWDQEIQLIPIGELDKTNFKIPHGKTVHLQAVDAEKTDDLFDFVCEKEYIYLEIGKKDIPLYEQTLPAGVIFKSLICKALVFAMFPVFRKRVLKGERLLSERWAHFLHIEQRACNTEAASSLIPLMNFWEKCSKNEKKLIKGAVAAYVESRILRSYFVKKEQFWVPALLSLQVTDACNLKCLGCEVSKREKINPEFRYRILHKHLREFHALGGRHVLLLGGEPLMLGDRLFDLLKEFNDIYFVLFSNATLFKEEYCKIITERTNILPIFSVDGTPEETAHRRGKHVFESVLKAQGMLNKYGLLNGISIMLHDGNHQMLIDNNFFKEGYDLKHRFVMFVTYTNPRGCDKIKALDLEKQMKFYLDICLERRKGYPFYFLPQDEMFVHGGCGGMRGIFHINGADSLTPCPFSFDTQLEYNMSEKSLKDVLKKHNSLSAYPCHANGLCNANFVTMQKLREALEKNV